MSQPEKKCRICGCTDNRACPGGCHWVAPDLCSRCAIKLDHTKGRMWEECEHGIWLSPCYICKEAKEAALLGAFLNRWEDMLDQLKTIREIKNLALQVRNKVPEEWWLCGEEA